ncbi:MFS transporter [Mycolicibacterium sp.]|uniref:MFS transporter n=1 Tax=Mycolicibacterium sp. TaxID=2320850 RepID=UPI001A258DB4|nr:MFS transporter [Mycolicibacterium sp.]MBJ7337014.1 MFS transporter [Mycolicibacterium sp.]
MASCLAVTTEMLPVGLLPAIGQSFQVADSVTGLLVGLYAVMVAALAVPLTLATARFARKPLLLTTVLCYAISNLTVAFAPTFAVLAAGRVLGGVTHALFFSLCIGYVPRLITGPQVGRALAIAAGGATAGFVLGVPLSTSLGTALGWRASFAVLAALSVLTLLLVAVTLPQVPNDRTARHDSEVHSGRTGLAAVVSSNALTFLGQFTLYTYVTLLFLAVGVGPTLIGPLLLLCGACGVAGLVYAARTLDHRPRRTTIVVLTTVIAAVLVLGVGMPALIPVIVAAAVWNGAFGGVPSIYQACAVRTRAVSPELAGAWVNATANFGIAGGSAIGAALLPAIGIGGLPWVSATLVGAGLAVSLAARRAFPSRP